MTWLARGLSLCGFLWLCATLAAQAAVQISAETQIRSIFNANKLKPGAEDIVITNHLDLSSRFAKEFRDLDGITSIRVLLCALRQHLVAISKRQITEVWFSLE
jgi:hypothetical protein